MLWDCPVCGSHNGGAYERSTLLRFLNGHKWSVDSTIFHLIEVHGWQPVISFVEDVMMVKLITTPDPSNVSPKGVVPIDMRTITPVGKVPKDFLKKLKALIEEAGPDASNVW